MSTTAATRERRPSGFSHEALLYAGMDDYLDRTLSFIREGLEGQESMLVVVSAAKIAMLRAELKADADGVQFGDMDEIGTNPARIIPAWREFVDAHADGDRPFRGIGEPIWPGRSPAELAECQRHESLLNLAFADSGSWRLLCPYDTESLDPAVIAEAHHGHPVIVDGPDERHSPSYRGLDAVAAPFDWRHRRNATTAGACGSPTSSASSSKSDLPPPATWCGCSRCDPASWNWPRLPLGSDPARGGPTTLGVIGGGRGRVVLAVGPRLRRDRLHRARPHQADHDGGHQRVGTRFPAYCTSMGRVLLAGQPDEWLDHYLEHVELRPFTSRTITEPERLRRVLAKVRSQGFAFVNQELEEQLRSVAAPVRGVGGEVVAAVNISMHAGRGGWDLVRRDLLPHLLSTTAAISEDMAAGVGGRAGTEQSERARSDG